MVLQRNVKQAESANLNSYLQRSIMCSDYGIQKW